MFERAGQINARFAGGSLRSEEVMPPLLALGLEERQITIVMRADPGGYQAPVQEAGLLRQLLRRFGGTPAAVTGPVPDALMMIYLSKDGEQAEQVQAILHRCGATRVDYYPAGQVATDKNRGDDHDLFTAAFPDSEQRHRAPNAVAPGEASGTP